MATSCCNLLTLNPLDAGTIFYQHLIVVLAPVDSCVVKRCKISQISQRVMHKSSKKSSKRG